MYIENFNVSGTKWTKMFEKDGDWQGYGSLQFTINCGWERTVTGGFNIFDQEALGSPDLEYGDSIEHGRSIMYGEGTTHVVIEIDPIATRRGSRMLNLDSVRKLELIVPASMAGEQPASVTNVRLSKEKNTPDEISHITSGDTIIHIQHHDIRSFTYQPENYIEPEDIQALKREFDREMEAFKLTLRNAELLDRKIHYSRAVLFVAEIASIARANVPWHFGPKAKRRNLSQALELMRAENKKVYECNTGIRLDRVEAECASTSHLNTVRHIPDLSKLRIDGNKFLDPGGRPVLICSMDYAHDSALNEFFAPDTHKRELLAIGGGHRYDIDFSPVYDAYHKNPDTERVGWRGWCGHLIRDQWSMGGRKENMLICLESSHILEAIKEYNKENAPSWRGSSDLMYVILAYELRYICYCEESQTRFRAWLKEKHGDIATVNEKWGTAYQNFDEIIPPPTDGHAAALDINRAVWFDWASWNMRRFTDHMVWARDDIRQYHPTIPICSGASSAMISPNIGVSGIDEELIIHELNDVVLQEGKNLMELDLLHALAEYSKPMVDPEHGGGCDRWFINYLHGKSTLSMFAWYRQPCKNYPSSTLFSPIHGNATIPYVLEHFTTALDIRRLSDEITAFWDIPREVAIMYSKTSMIQVDPKVMGADTTPYLQAMAATHEAGRCLDTGITFMTEKQLLAGKGSKFKVVLVPGVANLPEDVFAALDKYVNDGGTVVVTPESLIADEYNRPVDYLCRWGITVDETFIPEVEGFGEAVQQYDQTMRRTVHYGGGKTYTVTGGGIMDGVEVATDGLFQKVSHTGWEVVAGLPDGIPLLMRSMRGKGQVWYIAGSPQPASYYQMLDRIYENAGIERHLKVTDADGNRIHGLEARLVRRKNNDLVYISNETDREQSFRIETDRPIDSICEMRSMEVYDKPEGVLKPLQCMLFMFRESPHKRIKRWKEKQ